VQLGTCSPWSGKTRAGSSSALQRLQRLVRRISVGMKFSIVAGTIGQWRNHLGIPILPLRRTCFATMVHLLIPVMLILIGSAMGFTPMPSDKPFRPTAFASRKPTSTACGLACFLSGMPAFPYSPISLSSLQHALIMVK